MGGKVKQRTKGNTKPSSSGRAADLLSREGSTGFIGFGNAEGETADSSSSLQFVSPNTDPDMAVHVDFHVVMKKLTKRDAVTKLKAVQEFGELCKTNAMEAVLAALPYWPRLYNKLAMDVDYRVREATQHAMNQMACRVGRNLAPHLKGVMGIWICCQCDTYSPVASAAQKAFGVAFSENKQAEVLGFCKKEIVEYLIDNLMNQTADTMSDPELVEEKDRLTKFVRVTSSSLLGLGKFITTVSEDVNTAMEKYSHRLLSEKKFWKFGRHKSPQIRSSFFSLITVYCQKLPHLARICSSSLCPIVLGSIDDADATVSSNLWEAVLQVVTTIQDCWQCVNIEKAVLPKFWNFLSNAAYGNAAVVMVSLLPFVNRLPGEVVSPGSGFSQRMLSKLIEGLNQAKVQQSPSETKAVVSAFMDCVSYFILPKTSNITNADNELNKVRVDVVDQLITVIDLSFSPKSLISSSSLYERLFDFLRISTDLDDITSHFWQEFDPLIRNKLQGSSNKGNQTMFQLIVKCLCCLKLPGTSSGQSQCSTKVRFKETNEDRGEIKQDSVHPMKETPHIDVALVFGGKLLTTVNKVLGLCLQHVFTDKSESHLIVVTQLVKEFFSVPLLNDVVQTVSELSPGDSVCTNVSDIKDICELSKLCINALVLPLIGDNGGVSKDKWLLLLVEMSFVLFVEVDEDDKMEVLESIFQVNSTSKLLYFIVNEIFKTALFHRMSEQHGLGIGKRVVNLLETCLSCSNQENGFMWKIMDLCFAHDELLRFFFTKDLLKEMFDIFHHNLTDDYIAVSRLHSILQTIEKYIENTVTNSKKFGRKQDLLNDIVTDILRLRLLGYSEQSDLSQCCQSLIKAASSDDGWLHELTKQIIHITTKHLHSNQSTTFEKFYIFVEAALEVIQAVSNGSYRDFLKMLNQVIPSAVQWDELRSKSSQQSLWHILPFLDGELVFSEPLTVTCLDEDNQLTDHHKITLFLAHTLKDIFPSINNTVEEQGSVSEEEWRVTLALELLWMRECLQRTPSLSIGNTENAFLTKYNSDLQPLFDWLSLPENQPLLLALFEKSHSCGGLWSLTLKSLIKEIQNNSSELQLDSLITTCQSEECYQSVLQTLQCLIGQDTSIYNLKVIVEVYGRKWREMKADDSLGQMFCLSVIACAFERWVFLTKDSEIGTLECRLTLLDTLEDIRRRKDTNEDLLLFSCCLNDVQMTVISVNLSMLRLFKLVVASYSMEMSSEQWDMILCCMLDWLQSCNESNLTLVHVTAFTNHVCQLVEAVSKVLCDATITSSPSEESPMSDEAETTHLEKSSGTVSGKPLIEKLAGEWQEFFSNSACNNLLRLISTVATTNISSDSKSFISFHHLSESLSSACAYLTVDNLKGYCTSKTGATDSSKWQEDFLSEFSPHLESHFSAFQVASYRLLLKIVPVLAANTECKKQSNDEEDDPSSPPLDEIMSVINNGQAKLHDVLSEAEVPFGETLAMTDDVEALHISRSFLVAWKLLLEYFASSSEECRVEYANYLRRGKHLNELLEILFRILPRKPGDGKRMLEGSKHLEEKCLLGEEFVHCLAFEAYYDLLRTLPALVRQWWNNLDKLKAAIVERYTTINVSPLLCEKELQAVQRKKSTSCDNMEIVTRSSTREVIAYYKIEEISIELIVSLSASHPLGLITVNCGKRVGVKINQWRLWMMQLTTFLMHQNGSIIEGLMLWKRNVDKKFEGVDDCMICFSVIHGSNYSLPKLSCKTCKKKFHSACLYRWFSTSNNSTCPLCRNLF